MSGKPGLKNKVLRFGVLGTGSSANSYIFEYGNFSFIVDNGFPLSEFGRRMDSLAFDTKKLHFIFLTHTHSDHYKGVEALARNYGLPVVAHRDLRLPLKGEGEIRKLDILPGQKYQYQDLCFEAFNCFHDAPCTLGYHFTMGEKSFTIITDTGKTNQEMETLALRSNYLFLEANYSHKRLLTGPYPAFLKERIRSDWGHLSNLDSGTFMARLVAQGGGLLERIYLCHLSENNNSPKEVYEEVDRLYGGEIPYQICPRSEGFQRVPCETNIGGRYVAKKD